MMFGRKTMYRGIPMRSRLEADYAATLDSQSPKWAYEPCCFAGPGGQHLPDFVQRDAGNGRDRYIEIKPVDYPEAAAEVLRARMETIWLTDPDAELLLIWWEFGAGVAQSWHTFGSGFDWSLWNRENGFCEASV